MNCLHFTIRSTTVLSLALIVAGCSPSSQNSGDKQASASPSASNAAGGSAKGSISGEMRTESAAGLSYQVPASWTSGTPSSSMRAAQYTLPSSGGGEASELVLYFFGQGSGGSAQANIERWIGQMQQPDGKPSADVAQRDSKTIGGFNVSVVRPERLIPAVSFFRVGRMPIRRGDR